MGNRDRDITHPYNTIKNNNTNILFICDHASNIIHSKYKNLGLIIIDEEHYGIDTERTSDILNLFPKVQQLYLILVNQKVVIYLVR